MNAILRLVTVFCGALLLFSATCLAKPLLAVDFNAGAGTPSPTQLGWSAFAPVSSSNQAGPISAAYTGLDTIATSGTVTVTLAAGTSALATGTMTARDRSTMVNSTFPSFNLYRDLVCNVASGPLTVSLTGLIPGMEYFLSYTAYDNSASRTMTVTDYTGGTAGSSASVSWTAGTVFNADTDEDLCTRTISVTANASGVVTVRVTANTGGAIISGLALAEAWHPATGNSSILPIDFNAGWSAPSSTQISWVPFAPVSSSNQAGPISATYTGMDAALTSGTVTVTVTSGVTLTGSGNLTSRDRTTMTDPTFPLYYLYRDLVCTIESGPMTIGISGLKPSMAYQLSYTAYDNSTTKSMTIADYTTGVLGSSASVSWTAGTVFEENTDPSLCTKTIAATSNAQGQLVLRVTPSTGGAIICGLKISRTPSLWNLVVNQVAGQDWSIGFLNHWNSASDGSGSCPESINTVDTYVNNQYQLLTPTTSSTFPAGSLVFSGPARLTLLTGDSETSAIPCFASTGGSIVQGVDAVTQNLKIGDYENAAGSMILSASSGSALTLDVDTLHGMGDFKLMGGGIFQLNFSDASAFEGTIRLLGGILSVQMPLATKGGLTIGSSTQMVLNSAVYVTSLNIGGTQLAAGLYPYATLHASYPAIFINGSSSGLIAVYDVDTAGPVRMGGVNLSCAEWGTADGVYGVNYRYPTESEFDYYHGKGLNLIRLPFRWEHIQPMLNAPLDALELARIDTVVGYARTRGMKIVLDVHNYDKYNGSLVGSSAVPDSAFRDLWRRLADHFKSETAIYGYGLMNEPHGTGGAWKISAQEATWGIREVDTTHYVMVGGDDWSGAASWESSNSRFFIFDPVGRIIYEAHCYFVADLSLTYDAANAYPELGIDRARPFVSWLKAHRLNGYIGEFGVPYNDTRWLECMDLFLDYVSSNGLSTTYWAGGPSWSASDLLNCEPHNGIERPQIDYLDDYP